jgi:ABC-type branched-subunit amino acid transport system ATPase component/branched-subunit amino acid ABC-type transport system permease component
VQSFLQFLIVGLGAGATYALFAQGAVLIYRGSGLVNFAQGAVGTFAAYIAFVDLVDEQEWGVLPAAAVAVAAAGLISLLFQAVVLRALGRAAPIIRVIATIGLLGLLQAIVLKRYGTANRPVDTYLPDDVFRVGDVVIQESRMYLVGITLVVTVGLWAWTRFTRVGLAISASAQNERAVQTLGWSPNRLAGLTWTLGGLLGGFAAVLAAPLTGLSPITFTIVVTVAGLGAALLGGFQSFPLTLLGGLIIGVGEAMATLYGNDVTDLLGQDLITGLNRMPAFLVIFIVVVVRGRGLPLRSHVAMKLPRLGTGQINARGVLIGGGIALALLFFAMDDAWAQATYISLATAIMVLSIVVLTGYAGQISLAQWAFAGIGALLAGRLIRAGLPTELAIVAGVLLTIPVGLIFAVPALRTRGVNLAVVTLGLGFLVSEVVFANPNYLGDPLDGGTRIGPVELFGMEVDAFNHPHAWAAVSLGFFVLLALLVANLRRSRTGRRLIAVRTNERAASSLGISVFGVKLYAFAVSAGLAAVAGILVGFKGRVITYADFNVFASINSLGYAVIGGLGYALGAVFAAPNAIGGLGTRIIEGWIGLGAMWDLILGSLLVFLILIAHQNGVADVLTHPRHLWEKLRLVARKPERPPLPPAEVEPVAGATLSVSGLTVRFGSVVAVHDVSLEVRPGEVVGLIGPNGAGKTTFIDAVTGFVQSEGSIRLDDRRLDRMNATMRARLGLRRSFQSLELFDDVSVEENLHAGSDLHPSRLSWVTDLFWPGRHELPPTALAAVHSFGLEDDLDTTPEELPYGRRRLVGIARTVASGPSVAMLDEPAAGLDENESAELARLIRRLADERNMGVLLVEHDVGMVMSTCDRIVVIDYGSVIATGTPDEIRRNPAVRDAYLGHGDGEADGDEHGPKGVLHLGGSQDGAGQDGQADVAEPHPGETEAVTR